MRRENTGNVYQSDRDVIVSTTKNDTWIKYSLAGACAAIVIVLAFEVGLLRFKVHSMEHLITERLIEYDNSK